MNEPEPTALEELAQVCRNRYIQLRRVFAGHPRYTAGKRWDTCFLKLAKLLQEQGWGLEYLDAQFAANTASIPIPNQLYSDASKCRYRAYLQGRPGEGADVPVAAGSAQGSMRLERHRRLQAELRHITTRLAVGQPLEQILWFHGSPISALTRYCVARRYGLPQVAEAFKKSAQAQLCLHEDYREIYSPLVRLEGELC
jgi:hypothetical protein